MRVIHNGFTNFGLVGKSLRRYLTTTALTATGLMALATPSLADNWTDHTATEGSISIDTNVPNTTNITQYTDFVKVQGDGDINAGWTVNVAQPSSSSKYVLYDIENDPTMIMGALNANGEIYIFDQNGVIFGRDSQVNVGSIVTSTQYLDDSTIKNKGIQHSLEDYIAFGGAQGSIVNEGKITVAEAGLASFVGNNVKNSGVINAKMGTVVLAATGKEVATADLYGDGLVEIALDGETGDALVENKGKIQAEGGTVIMTATAAKNAVDNVINMEGVVDVSSVSVQGGKIILGGGNKGVVKVSGKLDASGTKGGDIKVTGQKVDLTETSELVNGGDNSNTYVYGTDLATFRGSLRTGKDATAEISGHELVLGGTLNLGEGSVISFDPVILTVGAGEAATFVSALNNNGVTVNVEASEQIIINSAIDSSAQLTNSVLRFKDEDANNNLQIDLNAQIKLGALQNLIGDGTVVNVANTGLIQNGIDVASGNGATVNVAAGTYSENVTIDKSNLTLLSVSGRDLTIIDGPDSGPEEGGIYITAGTNNVQVGDVGKGFKIFGLNGDGTSEKAAVYLKGDHTNVRIIGNELVAQGDSGFTSEYSAVIDNLIIDNNIFSGQTFMGANPSGIGSSTQFALGNNVPRQLAVIGGGAGGGNTSNVTFTNNVLTGKTGGISTNDGVSNQGNWLATIDSKGATITGNAFMGSTTGNGFLRVRGTNTLVSGNGFDGANLTGNGVYVSAAETIHGAGTQPDITHLFANNFFVSNATVSSTQFGTTDIIGKTIQGAVNVSETGAFIYVINGTYNESVNVNKAVTLMGANNGRSATDGTVRYAEAIVKPNSPGFNVTAAGVTIDGFTIDGGDDGVLVNYAGPGVTTIRNNIIKNGTQSGIDGQSWNAQIVADDNWIHDMGADGITLTGNHPGSILSDNRIEDVGNDGINIWNTSNGTQILRNKISDAVRNGITIDGSQAVVAQGNDINNVGGHGILAKDGVSGVTIDANLINNTGKDGIHVDNIQYVFGTMGTVISNNVIGYTDLSATTSTGAELIGKGANGGDGIFLTNAAANGGKKAVITGNKITGAKYNGPAAKGSGILVTNSNAVEIGEIGNGNIVKNVGSDGIVVRNDGVHSYNVNIKGNTIDGTQRTGIYTHGLASSSFDTNTITNTGRYAAIFANGGFDLNVQNNIINNNDEVGILLNNVVSATPSFSTVQRNVINNTGEDKKASDGTNSGDAIQIIGSNVWVIDNQIGLAGGNIRGDGIYVAGPTVGAGVVVRQNDINDTDAHGVNVENMTSVSVGGIDYSQGNIITNIDGNGVNLSNVSNADVSYNTIDNVGVHGIQTNGGDNLDLNYNIISDVANGWGHSGINVYGGTNIDILNNDLDRVGGQGIYVEGPWGAPATTLNIKDNTIDAAEHNAIYVKMRNGATISGNAIVGTASGHGILLELTTAADVLANKIKDVAASGVQLWYGNTGTKVNNNQIKNAINGSGIEILSDATNITVDNNVITGAKQHGIFANGVTGPLTITNNDISAITDFDGIKVGGSTGTIKINANDIYNVGRHGISASGGIDEVNDNRVLKTGQHGILVTDSAGVSLATGVDLKRNKVGDSITGSGAATRLRTTDGAAISHANITATASNIGNDGIHVENAGYAEIIGNTVRNTVNTGIFLDPSDYSVIAGNTLSAIGGNGITSWGNSYVTIGGVNGADANTLSNIGKNGIVVALGTGNKVYRNEINTTGVAGNLDGYNGAGVFVFASSFADIFRNNIGTGSGVIKGDGVLLLGGDNALVTRNTIDDTSSTVTDFGNGVHVVNSDNVTVGGAGNLRNTITDAGWDGVRVAGGSDNVTVDNNKIDGAARSGVYLVGSNTANVKLNDIDDAGHYGIFAFGGDKITLDDNDIDDTGLDGIFANIVATNGLVIKNNDIGTHGGNIGENGIEVEKSHGAIITGNETNDTGANGIYVNASNNIEIGGTTDALGNTITRAGAHGIYVNGGSSALIQYNKVLGSLPGFTIFPPSVFDGTAGAQLDGIHVEGNNGVEILNNTIAAGQGFDIFGFTRSGGNGTNQHGVYVSGSDNAVIDQNNILGDVLGNGVGAGVDGIHVVNSNALTVGGLTPVLNGNKIFSTGNDGIYIDGSAGSLVLNNIIGGVPFMGVAGDGIDMQNILGTLVAGNIITDVGGDGIQLSYSALSALLLNFINGAGNDGIAISNSALFAAALNQIGNAGNNGIELFNTYLGLVGYNQIDGSTNDGIKARVGAGLLITENDVTNSGDDGIDAGLVALTNITNNTVTGAGGDGVQLFLSAFSRIEDNEIDNVGDDGIDVDLSAFTDIDGNTIDNVSRNGIEVSRSAFVDIDNNDVGLNGTIGRNGIDVRSAYDVEITNNEIGTNVARNGIRVGSSGLIVIDTNTIDGVGTNGIRLHNNAGDVQVLNNLISNTGTRGLYASGANNGNIEVSGNTFTNNIVGAEFQSGTIDLTQVGNTFIAGVQGKTALRFAPGKGAAAQLVLVNDGNPAYGGTIGAQTFTGYTDPGDYYVELANEAFYAPGSPTLLNGLNSTYETIKPWMTGGILSQADFDILESRFHHYPDGQLVGENLGLFWFGYVPVNPAVVTIDQSDLFNVFGAFNGDATGLNVRITGLPRLPGQPFITTTASTTPQGLNNIQTFAGNQELTPDQLNNIETAAGEGSTGNNTQQQNAQNLNEIETEAGGEAADTNCWSDAASAAAGGQTVSVVYGGSMDDNLNQAAACGTSF